MSGPGTDFVVWQVNQLGPLLKRSEDKALSTTDRIHYLDRILGVVGRDRTRVALRKHIGYLAGCIFDRATGECACDIWKRS